MQVDGVERAFAHASAVGEWTAAVPTTQPLASGERVAQAFVAGAQSREVRFTVKAGPTAAGCGCHGGAGPGGLLLVVLLVVRRASKR